MTLDEIMKLPDAELTRLAAERVMGWTSCNFELADTGEYDSQWIDGDGNFVVRDEEFNPCRDMTSAWMLNERMRELTESHAASTMRRYRESLRTVTCRRINWSPIRARNNLAMFLAAAQPIDLTRAAVWTAMEAE